MIDVLVAGAGPVGLAAALYLSDAGLSVTIAEPRPAPIDKACGEGLMPAAVDALAALGIEPAGQPLNGIRYRAGERSVAARFRHGTGRGVRRTQLQDALLSTVLKRGISIVQRPVSTVVQRPDSILAADLQARYLVAADGLHSPIRRALGLNTDSRRAPRWGQRRHFELEPWTDLVEVHWSPAAEAYVTPVGPDKVGVAILSGCREPFDLQLQQFPRLVERLAVAAGSRVRGAGPLRQAARRRVAGRVLLVGDAAGYVDALTGEGISVGLSSARALAECLRADRPQDYERAWRHASRRYRVLTEALVRSAGIPLLRKRIVPAAAAAPRLFEAIVGQLAR